jgi:Big-like domain-containing protein
MRRVTVCSLVLVSAAALLGGAAARDKAPPTPAQRIATAQKQVQKLKKSSFGPGQRARVLQALGRARTALRLRRTCPAIDAVDNARSLLVTSRTWRNRRIPPSVSRTIAPSLAQAQVKLVSGASRCAAKTFTKTLPGLVRRGGANLVPKPSIETTNEQGDEEELDVEAGPYRPRTNPGPPVTIAPDPRLGGGAGFRPSTAGVRAAEPVNLFGGDNYGVAPRSGGEPKELTVAIGHNVMWYTGNTSAGYSLDGGKSWAPPSGGRLDPSTILADPPNNRLCCDQQVIYAPKQNLFVWVLQYWCPPSLYTPAPPPPPAPAPGPTLSDDCGNVNGTNLIRFAIATPEDIRRQANAGTVGFAWRCCSDIRAQDFGEGPNAWFDYSTLSVNDGYVNFTVNIFEGRKDPNGLDAEGLALRINADSLVQNKFQAEYFLGNFHMSAAQEPAGSLGTETLTSYFAANNSLSQTRVWEWRNGSSTPIVHDVDHASIPVNTGAILGTDNQDWNARAGGGLLGQTLSSAWSKNRLVVANMAWRDQCTAKCGEKEPTLKRVHDHTFIHTSRIDTTTWKSVDGDVFNSSVNLSWPALGVARSGAIGLSMLASADSANPQPVVGFLDDDQYTYAFGAGGPQPGNPPTPPDTAFSGGTGDYYSLLPGPEYESFVYPFRSIDTDALGAVSDNWRFVIYGHGPPRAASPPSVTIVAPVDGRSFPQGTPIVFRANVSDNEDGEVPYYAIKWASDGIQLASGGTPYLGSLITYPYLPIGTHDVAVIATDSTGRSTTKQVTVIITPVTPTAPVARITKPTDGDVFPASGGSDAKGGYVDVPLAGTASDPKGKPLTITWTDTHIENNVAEAPVVFATNTLTPTIRLYVHNSNCGTAAHDLTLTVDNGTEKTSATIRVRVTATICVK